MRPLPWTSLLAAIGAARFAEVQGALAAAGTSDLDRDAFLLNGTVAALLRELMPEDAPTEAVNAYGGLLHMLHAAWARDWPVVPLNEAALRALLAAPAPLTERTPPAAVCYVQLPERIVWAEPQSGTPHEPLDGLFVIAEPGRLRALAVLDFREARQGFTTMEAETLLPAPAPADRTGGGGTKPFASLLPGGERAGLHSLADTHELLALAHSALRIS